MASPIIRLCAVGKSSWKNVSIIVIVSGAAEDYTYGIIVPSLLQYHPLS